jgi:hypothetical protein
MERTRQLIPEGLAELPPGPELAAVLSRIDVKRLVGYDCVEVLKAQHRQACHEQARLMAVMVEVGLCGIGPDEQLPRMDAPDEFSADEIRAALSLTRSAASAQLWLAWDLLDRLPQVHVALDTGVIDVPKARVFSEWTHGLTDAQTRTLCDLLLPEAPNLTTGQLIDRIKKMAIAIDPDWARRRYEEAVRDRGVVGYRNPDGTANVSGLNLPAERAAAACANIDALAKKIKHAGDRRPIGHIRADLYLGMLDGTYTGWDQSAIITHMLRQAAEETTREQGEQADHQRQRTAGGPTVHEHGGADGGRGPGEQAPDRQEQCDDQPVDPEQGDGEHDQPSPDSHGPAGGATGDRPGDKERPPDRNAQLIPRRAGIELRVQITTLLGLDDHPAEIAGWGFVHARSAREITRDQTAAQWRYAITDEHGRLLYEGTTRKRPDRPLPHGTAPCRGGIIELHITLSGLRALSNQPAQTLSGWAKVIADLARQADQHEQHNRPQPGGNTNGGPSRGNTNERRPGSPPGRRDSRRAGAALRRRTEIRDRTCTHPGCRAPAHGTDGDHTRDWPDGGPTQDDNIASTCRHDHRVKHQGGWKVTQPRPGELIWTSRLGHTYQVPPPLIIEPLPDPIPRDPPPDFVPLSEETDTPTWREPAQSEPDPEPPPAPPSDPGEPPPF